MIPAIGGAANFLLLDLTNIDFINSTWVKKWYPV